MCLEKNYPSFVLGDITICSGLLRFPRFTRQLEDRSYTLGPLDRTLSRQAHYTSHRTKNACCCKNRCSTYSKRDVNICCHRNKSLQDRNFRITPVHKGYESVCCATGVAAARTRAHATLSAKRSRLNGAQACAKHPFDGVRRLGQNSLRLDGVETDGVSSRNPRRLYLLRKYPSGMVVLKKFMNLRAESEIM